MASTKTTSKGTIETSDFGTNKDGNKVTLFTLNQESGISVGIIDYGAIITHINVPDKNGELADVVLGHDNIKGYEEDSLYLGCVVGRYGNRIAHGKFALDGKAYELFPNNNGNALHGGKKGFNKQLWKANPFQKGNAIGVELNYTSPDGEEGYPGSLTCKITYTLTAENALQIDYKATTDKTTIVNLTNHTYFNLKDGGKSNILEHELQLNASHFTPINENMIPTGEIVSVSDTPFDFQTVKSIGKDINVDSAQLQYGNGYDHNYVLDKSPDTLELFATVTEPESGRTLEAFTTEPGVQLYSGNFLDSSIGKHDISYGKRSGFCLETQHFPDSPNQPQFPSTVLRPGETYKSTTAYRFGVKS